MTCFEFFFFGGEEERLIAVQHIKEASPAREKLGREMGRREANQGGYCDSPTYFNQRIWGQRLF